MRETRSNLFPSIGHLYPDGVEMLARAEDDDAITKALQTAYPEYASLWLAAPVDAVRDEFSSGDALQSLCTS